MRVLITGVSGFVGSHTAREALREGWEVVGVVRNTSDSVRFADFRDQIELIEGDLGNVDALEEPIARVRPDVCIHHAWYAEPGKYPHALENIDSLHGTLQLILLLGRSGCRRFVGLGSCFEYDFRRGWLREDGPLDPLTLYAASKIACSQMLGKVAEKAEIEAAWVRLFYQYGPQEDLRRLVPAVTTALLKGENVDTTFGEQVRDFLHIEDVARGICAVAESDLQGPVNVGSGIPVTVRQIIESIGEATGRRDLVRFGARPYNPTDPPFIVANNEKLKQGTSWAPQIDLQSGIAETTEWWKKNLGL